MMAKYGVVYTTNDGTVVLITTNDKKELDRFNNVMASLCDFSYEVENLQNYSTLSIKGARMYRKNINQPYECYDEYYFPESEKEFEEKFIVPPENKHMVERKRLKFGDSIFPHFERYIIPAYDWDCYWYKETSNVTITTNQKFIIQSIS